MPALGVAFGVASGHAALFRKKGSPLAGLAGGPALPASQDTPGRVDEGRPASCALCREAGPEQTEGVRVRVQVRVQVRVHVRVSRGVCGCVESGCVRVRVQVRVRVRANLGGCGCGSAMHGEWGMPGAGCEAAQVGPAPALPEGWWHPPLCPTLGALTVCLAGWAARQAPL